jgi:hypothetical protein
MKTRLEQMLKRMHPVEITAFLMTLITAVVIAMCSFMLWYFISPLVIH